MIANIAMSDSNDEYPVVLPHGTRSFRLRLREAAALLVAETAGATVVGPYVTIDAGSELSVNLAQVIDPNGKTLYVRCPSGAATAELFSW